MEINSTERIVEISLAEPSRNSQEPRRKVEAIGINLAVDATVLPSGHLCRGLQQSLSRRASATDSLQLSQRKTPNVRWHKLQGPDPQSSLAAFTTEVIKISHCHRFLGGEDATVPSSIRKSYYCTIQRTRTATTPIHAHPLTLEPELLCIYPQFRSGYSCHSVYASGSGSGVTPAVGLPEPWTSGATITL